MFAVPHGGFHSARHAELVRPKLEVRMPAGEQPFARKELVDPGTGISGHRRSADVIARIWQFAYFHVGKATMAPFCFLLRLAASMKAKISMVTSFGTGGCLVRMKVTISESIGA